MADLKYIEFPQNLNAHTLGEQELENLTPGQKALAKDWNIINRKADWLIHRMIEDHNLMVDHDKVISRINKWLWILGGVPTFLGVVYTALRILKLI